jgi:hypothetical protein
MSFVERATPGVTHRRLLEGWQRFRHGFQQLVLTFQALRGDALAWKRYLRVCTVQALVTAALAGVFLSTARHSSEGLREERVRQALQAVNAVEPPAAEPATPADAKQAPKRSASHRRRSTAKSTPAPGEAPKDQAQPADGEAEARAAFQEKVQELQKGLVDLSTKAGPTAIRRDREFQEARQALDEQFSDLEHDAQDIRLSAEEKAALVRLGAQLDVLEHQTKPGFWDSAWALVLSIYGALSVTQAIVIALSRDYHAAVARDASLLLGVAPEDPPTAPRIHLNFAWVRRKLQQRTRSLLCFLPGVALISVVSLPFPARAVVTSVLTAVWAAYWWVVWTASKSARAWERKGVAPPPFYLRWWHAQLSSLPYVGGLARALEALWARLTRVAYSPAEAVEAQPAEFSGLAAARALQLIPLVKLYVRPLVPVAAARLLAERSRPGLRLESPKEQASLAAQRAAVPASPGAIAARDEM